jgi:hypothetical protein
MGLSAPLESINSTRGSGFKYKDFHLSPDRDRGLRSNAESRKMGNYHVRFGGRDYALPNCACALVYGGFFMNSQTEEVV